MKDLKQAYKFEAKSREYLQKAIALMEEGKEFEPMVMISSRFKIAFEKIYNAHCQA